MWQYGTMAALQGNGNGNGSDNGSDNGNGNGDSNVRGVNNVT